MSHTPGPWEPQRPNSRYGLIDVHRVGEERPGHGRIAACATEDDARLIAAAPDLLFNLEQVTDALEATEEYRTSHGTHFAAIEARKLLSKLKEGG